MIYLVSNYFSSYAHTFLLALNASKVRLWPWYCYVKKGKSIQIYTFAFSWTGGQFDCLWILLFEGWTLPEGGSQSLWGLQCSDRIPTGRASRARGGQQIPLAHRQAFFESYEIWKTDPLMRISQCGTECYMYELSKMGTAESLAFFKICFIVIQGLLVDGSALRAF